MFYRISRLCSLRPAKDPEKDVSAGIAFDRHPLTIFLIHGLFNQRNENVLFLIGGLKFYREGTLYALHIGLNILNMLLSLAVFVLSTARQVWRMN